MTSLATMIFKFEFFRAETTKKYLSKKVKNGKN
jgi:hypothetical protein